MNTILGAVLTLGLVRTVAECTTAAVNAAGHAVKGEFTAAGKITIGIPLIPIKTAADAAATALFTLYDVASVAVEAARGSQHSAEQKA